MADRHQFRANWHDYNGGIYFVTICCADKRHYFGSIQDDEMHLNAIGRVAEQCISQIANHHAFPVDLLNYVIMPNHIHMVIAVGAQYVASAASTASAAPSSQNVGALKPPRHEEPCADNHFNSKLAVVVRTYKAAVSRIAGSSARTIWQRNYYEHIIRDQRSYAHIMNYVDSNVERWADDCFNK